MNTILRGPETLWDEMAHCHETGVHRIAVIVFSQSNFSAPYSEVSRSYASGSNQSGWDRMREGRSRVGRCLDGSEEPIRLDHHAWTAIDYWYWLDEAEFIVALPNGQISARNVSASEIEEVALALPNRLKIIALNR